MQTTWNQGLKFPHFPKLDSKLETEIVVVGGGITGLLCAYRLASEGKRVVVLEAKKLAQDTTSLTTAFLTQYIDTDISQLQEIFGPKKTRQIWESHGRAIDLIEQIAGEEGIDCEYTRCSNFVYANTKGQVKKMKGEIAVAHKLGFRNI